MILDTKVEARPAGPWSQQTKVQMVLWEWTWNLLCRWTPKPLNSWRIIVLRWFGCRVDANAFVHQRSRIQMPWNVVLGARSCVGDRANLYSLERIHVGEGSVIAQEAYLCTGTHDFTDAVYPLLTSPIHVGAQVFVGARAFVLPGVKIGDRAVIGACAVVTANVDEGDTVAGNPARSIRDEQR